MIAILTWHFYYVRPEKKIFSSEFLDFWEYWLRGKSTFRSYDKLDDSSELFSPYQILNSIPQSIIDQAVKILIEFEFQSWTRSRIWRFAKAPTHSSQIFSGLINECQWLGKVQGKEKKVNK